MCEKCSELDEKIEHYRRIAPRITDKMTLESIAELVAELLAKKAELHPGEQK